MPHKTLTDLLAQVARFQILFTRAVAVVVVLALVALLILR